MSDTLLLNSNYEPISILPLSVIGWQHAIKLMYLGRVNVLETYPDWIIRSERLYNMYMRDLFQCQYCSDVFDFDELTIDHVVPRAKGGKTNWENCVTACKPCNHHKGDKTNIRPLNMPYKPDYYALVKRWKNMPFTVRQESWNKYLGVDKEVVNHKAA
jgi:hypothetical protein